MGTPITGLSQLPKPTLFTTFLALLLNQGDIAQFPGRPCCCTAAFLSLSSSPPPLRLRRAVFLGAIPRSDDDISDKQSITNIVPSSTSAIASSKSPKEGNRNSDENMNSTTEKKRTRSMATDADLYFQQYHKIPPPNQMHVTLNDLMKADRRQEGDGTTRPIALPRHYKEQEDGHDIDPTINHSNHLASRNILVIGDVHGCLKELKQLVHAATTRCHYERTNNSSSQTESSAIITPSQQLFQCILLVGDLCNKGPASAKVIQYVRTQKHWYTVRGNHDDGALAVALGDETRFFGKMVNGGAGDDKYHWILPKKDDRERLFLERKENENELKGNRASENNDTQTMNKYNSSAIWKSMSLSDEDVTWLANLPYTISISSKHHFEKEEEGEDFIIVHAGFVPNVKLEHQDIKSMVTIREVDVNCDDNHQSTTTSNANNTKSTDDNNISKLRKEWAATWTGLQHVIFGHDAKRGLQQQNPKCTGLDTGVVYGKELTGMILPEKNILSVKAEKDHCPIGEK